MSNKNKTRYILVCCTLIIYINLIIIFIVYMLHAILNDNTLYKEPNLYNYSRLSFEYNRKKDEYEKEFKDEMMDEKLDLEILPDTLKGYNVIAKLEIPKISLETYVLEETTESSLKVSVTKFWGADPNEVGNFCIAGHNFNKKNMFKNLKKLSVNDEIYITSTKNEKIKYLVYDILTVDPYNTTCVSQNTEGIREVTLITCTVDSILRLIVKAKEI